MLCQLEIRELCLMAKETVTSITRSTLGLSDPRAEIGGSSGGSSLRFLDQWVGFFFKVTVVVFIAFELNPLSRITVLR